MSINNINNNTDGLKKSLILLYPKIAYGKNRHSQGGSLITKNFAEFLKTMLDNVLKSDNTKTDFKKFMDIMEGFVGFLRH